MLKKITSLFVMVLISFHLSLSASETIRILAIGNSFSEDAVENYLYNLGQTDDVTFIIGNMYIGGCSLELHWSNANSDAKAYSYRKINASGAKTTTANVSIAEAVADENWDYISFQQVSQNSGQYATYFPYLTDLKAYVASLATNPQVKYMLHATWAYAQVNSHGGFANYGNNQTTMYEAIVDAASSAATTAGINIVVPSGTAIQNARTSFIGDNFCRDGYHLDLGVGRYTAASTWYEKLTGNSVVGNTYTAGLSASYVDIAQNAAHSAVLTPKSVTDMSTWVNPTPNPETFVTTYPINIDFGAGSTLSASPWNNFTSYAKGSSVIGLTDMNGTTTPVQIEVSEAFGGVNPNGPTTDLEVGGWSLPKGAVEDSFYGSGGKESTFVLSNLNPNLIYNFSMFASRLHVTDNRTTYIQAEGINTERYAVNSTGNNYVGNTTELATVNGIKPTANGKITIKIGAAADNGNSAKYFYINALQITMEEYIEPLPNPETFVLSQPINVNFGTGVSNSAKFWNNLNTSTTGTLVDAMKGEDGEQTPFKIEIVDRFGGFNTNGPVGALELNGWSIPQEVTKDALWGNAGDTYAGMNIVTGSFLLSNLNPNHAYDFSMLASRIYVSDNRETYIQAEGLTTERAAVNSSTNLTNLAQVERIQPKSDGTIKLVIGAGANNNQVNKFFYINALRIKRNLDFSTAIESEQRNAFDEIALSSNLVNEELKLIGSKSDARYEYAIYQLDGKIVKKGYLNAGEDAINVADIPASYSILTLRNSLSPETTRISFMKRK